MREFNVTGNCVKSEHYMVDITEKLKKIIAMVDKRRYFTINRARQYGKTTTLYLLQEALKSEYVCIKTSFEDAEDEMFSSGPNFCAAFLKRLDKSTISSYPNTNIVWKNDEVVNFISLGEHITNICKDNKVVLLIDEVDKSSNNRIFLHFLGLLRAKFLERNGNNTPTFHSVILAGVHDVKNIKQKMITAGTHTQSSGEGIYNSPWNIAAAFDVDMSFSAQEIETMLLDYESEHSSRMNKTEIAQEIYDYTSGYPFLVSRICKIIDEKLEQDWSRKGVQEAVKILLEESNTLFDDLHKNLENNKELSELMYELVIAGRRISFSWANSIISLGNMYGYIEKRDNKAVVSNKIFEIQITEYFISKEEIKRQTKTGSEVEDVVNGKQ
ncbi:MAG: AAA family ATPase, partial [Oscillospiraceae bacterium]|nr:AAA family ATPase [Oscillospiraceae bacterium]